jgi:tetratricopeptide (TPR) repeat protein
MVGMKNSCFIFFLSVFMSGYIQGQGNRSDSLLRQIESSPKDTSRVLLILEAAQSYYFSKPDSCLTLALQGLELSRKIEYSNGEVNALEMAGEAYRFLGDYPKSLEMQFGALQIYDERRDSEGAAVAKGFIGFTYLEMEEYRHALQYLLPAKPVLAKANNTVSCSFVSSHIGSCYTMLAIPDSAQYYNQEALRLMEFKAYPPLRTLVYSRLGDMYEKSGLFSEALNWYHKSLTTQIFPV